MTKLREQAKDDGRLNVVDRKAENENEMRPEADGTRKRASANNLILTLMINDYALMKEGRISEESFRPLKCYVFRLDRSMKMKPFWYRVAADDIAPITM